jgi:hypothetical protein
MTYNFGYHALVTILDRKKPHNEGTPAGFPCTLPGRERGIRLYFQPRAELTRLVLTHTTQEAVR